MRNHSVLTTLMGILGAVLFSLCLALSAFMASAVSGKLYYKTQVQLEIDPGIDRAAMEKLDNALGAYLSGDAHALDSVSEFNAREKAHMQDVYALFSLGRHVMALLGISGLALLGLGFCFAPRRRRFLRVSALGSALVLADHPGSFDSRYFGFVPLDSLVRMEPVFVIDQGVNHE